MNLNQIDFDKWKIINDIKGEKGERCRECKGAGYTECFNCNQDIECEECNGTGVFDGYEQDYKVQYGIDREKIKSFN